MFGDKEFDLAVSYYEQSLLPKMRDIIIEVTGYDKWKLILLFGVAGNQSCFSWRWKQPGLQGQETRTGLSGTIYPPIRRHHVLAGCPKNYFQTVGAKQHRSSGNKVEIGAGERHPLPQEFYTESNGNGELGQGRSGQDYWATKSFSLNKDPRSINWFGADSPCKWMATS